MKIDTIEFIKGVVGEDKIIHNGLAQVAFIGRSNVGKSSTINVLTGKKGMAKVSCSPGRTQQANFFLINNKFYLVDLPGYGFAKAPKEVRDKIHELIKWYFFLSGIEQKKVVLIIDAKVGPTKDDLEILIALEDAKKELVVIANKIDKLKKSEFQAKFKKIQELIGDHLVIPFSAEKKLGIKELLKAIE
jgi:GTP-binding protein